MITRATRIQHTEPYYFANKLAQIRAMNAQGDTVINLGIGSPDLPPPASAIDQLRSSATDLSKQSYQPYRGVPLLRTAFANWYKRHYQVDLDQATEVLPLMGSKEGLMHLCMAFLDQGDVVLVPNPGYPAYTSIGRLAGGVIHHYDLNDDNNYFPTIEALDTSAKMMFVNYPHMPTGATATIEQLTALVAWAKVNNVLIVHDNPYSHILNPNPISLLQIDGAKDICVELTSLSKNYHMAGWRIGALIGKSTYIDATLTFKSNMDSGMYQPLQEAAAVALNDDQFRDTYAQTYKERRLIAYQIMEALGCSYVKDRPGLFVWGKVPTHTTGEALSDYILDQGRVFITPGFIFGSAGLNYIRISLCAPVSQLAEALSIIKKLTP